MGPIDPIRPARLVRWQPRQAAREEREPDPASVNVTINIAAEPVEPAPSMSQPSISPAAHMLAQNARARGLRAGQKVLETARHVYLETEWSGPNDRRIPTGRITKTKI
jgi:hypothetical protein